MLDLLVRGGSVVDGTGAPARRADVGVRDGMIVSVGTTEEGAHAIVDADGLVVTPGFVDVHTHYDAQLAWDPLASPSSEHGVTTVLAGNCGFTVAPSTPAEADYIERMLAKVEGMPLDALHASLTWSWSSFGEWLRSFEGSLAVNAGFLAGHSTIRRVVMGEESVERAATGDEITAMVELLHRCLDEGALGLSSSQSHTHNDADGHPVPSRLADPSELVALAGVLADHPGASMLEFITSGCVDPEGFSDAEVDLMIAMCRAAGTPLNWNALGATAHNTGYRAHQLGAADRAREQGARIVALAPGFSSPMRFNFAAPMGLDGLPDWLPTMSLPIPERMAALRDAATRRFLASRAASPDAGILGRVFNWPALRVNDTHSPANDGLAGRLVGDIAEERRADGFDTIVDIALHDELQTGFLYERPLDDADWKVRVETWRDDRVVIGGSDAGAHLDQQCAAQYPTYVLGEIVRERGLLPIEEAVHLMSDRPARFYSLDRRGRVAVGWRADLVVLDPLSVGAGPLHVRTDLPGGAWRTYSEASGVHRVVVGGRTILEDGRPTGDKPGTVLRARR